MTSVPTTVPTTVPRLVTATQSLAITKELVKSALAAILLRRGLYEPDQFVPLKLVGADVPSLKRDHPGNARLLQILHDGIFDALARGHLHEAMVSVYRGAKTNVLETYTLTVEYSAPAAAAVGSGCAMAATSGRTPTVRIHVRRGDAAPVELGTASAATVDALRAQVAQALADLDHAVASLEPLPPRCDVTMYLTYQATAPVDYEPAHFIPCAFPPTPPPSSADDELTMMASPFHAVTMATAARVGNRPPPGVPNSATVAATRRPTSKPVMATPQTPPAPAVPPRRAPTTRPAHSISSTRFRLPASPPTGPPSSTPASTPPSHDAAGPASSTPHTPPHTSPAPPTHPPFPNDSPTRAPDGTVVACVCQMNEPDMHLVECDMCGHWSHVVCWGYFHGLDARLPETFACHLCGETGGPEQELALVRTAASVLWNEVPEGDAWAADNLALRMKITLDLAHHLFGVLVGLGYVHHRTTTASHRRRRSRPKSVIVPPTTLYSVPKSDPRAISIAKALFDPAATHLPSRTALHPIESRSASLAMVVPASYLSASAATRPPSAASSVTDDGDQFGSRPVPALPDLALVAASARSRALASRSTTVGARFRKPPSPRRLSQAARLRPTTAESQATVVLPTSQMSNDASTQGGAETAWPWLPERSASQRAAQRVREVLKAEEEEDPFRMPASADEERMVAEEAAVSRGRGRGRGRGVVKRGRSVGAAAAGASGRGGGASAKRVRRKA
ncbi:hypothetical protein GGF32_004530 [Allomyces javanicus]|nr:hypothetical protein GGF32_004530 [Allomyces javanicus]